MNNDISLDDLRYAKAVAIPIVDAVYARYDGQGVEVPGIDHLADIHADTGKMKTLEATADAQTRILIAATFAGGSLFGAMIEIPSRKQVLLHSEELGSIRNGSMIFCFLPSTSPKWEERFREFTQGSTRCMVSPVKASWIKSIF